MKMAPLVQANARLARSDFPDFNDSNTGFRRRTRRHLPPPTIRPAALAHCVDDPVNVDARLDRARRMLVDPNLAYHNISAIALDAGFGDLSYFNRVFRRRFGGTPSDRNEQVAAALQRGAVCVFLCKGWEVASGDFYRTKAAELYAQALHHESSLRVQAALEGLATAYIRLAEQADRNNQLDISYETPPPKEAEPDAKC